jgi:TonB family protein
MKTLVVKQIRKDGVSKVWKVKPSQSPCTFGTSRVSGINSIDSSLTNFEGVFQLQNDQWHYLDLNPKNVQTHQSLKVDNKAKLNFKESHVQFEVIAKEYDHMQAFSNLQKVGVGSHEIQLFSVTFNDLFIRSETLSVGKTFYLTEVHPPVKISGVRTEDWKSEVVEGFKVFQKTIKSEDISKLGHLSPKDLVDEESKKPMAIALSIALLLALLSFFVKKPEQQISTWQPKEAQRIVIDMENLKKRKVAKAQAVEIEKQDVQKAAGGSGKVSGLLKNLNVGRISTLVGKVSAGEAASKNIIVQNGIKAGQGVSGRALAALGKENKAGKDWNKEGSGQGVSVSTAGKAGGNSMAGLGGLKAGRTGEGGVGLIEDEGEVSGGLDRDIIAEYIKRQIGHILACYERQLSAKKDLGGKVSVKFTINGTGSVETQNITESTMKDATVEGCILNRVAKWNFPAPNGGTKVIVTYPFLFKSTN